MQKFLSIGALCGALAVILGAFGAHALKAKLSADELQTFETGVKYQFYHTFAICLAGLLIDRLNTPLLTYAGYLFVFGIVFFSGSLYLLASKNLLGIENWKWLGPVTPLGGFAFIAGWVLMLVSCFKK